MIPLSVYVGAAAFVVGLGAGYKITSNSYKADMLTAERAAHEKFVGETRKLNEVAAALEVAKNERKTVYRTIEKRVDKVVADPLYRGVCIDDSGLHAINDALQGRDTSKPDAAMPKPDAAGRKNGR